MVTVTKTGAGTRMVAVTGRGGPGRRRDRMSTVEPGRAMPGGGPGHGVGPVPPRGGPPVAAGPAHRHRDRPARRPRRPGQPGRGRPRLPGNGDPGRLPVDPDSPGRRPDPVPRQPALRAPSPDTGRLEAVARRDRARARPGG